MLFPIVYFHHEHICVYKKDVHMDHMIEKEYEKPWVRMTSIMA